MKLAAHSEWRQEDESNPSVQHPASCSRQDRCCSNWRRRQRQLRPLRPPLSSSGASGLGAHLWPGRYGHRSRHCLSDKLRSPAFWLRGVGLNKATVLVDGVNLFHGLSWEAVSRPFDPKYMPLKTDYMSTVDLVISCVDTKAARAQMHEAFFSHAGPWSNVRYWLDLGNSASSGQFVLGQPMNRANKRAADRLRCVSELFPSIIDVGSGEDAHPSCSAAEALDRQDTFINN